MASEMKIPGPPKDSATVILLRSGPSAGVEVFLMRRHRAQSFMGGAYVFPGGRLDDSDCEPGLAGRSAGLDGAGARRLLREPELSEDRALGLFFCVVRELFEEAGVLLARGVNGKMERLSSYRSRIHGGELTLLEMADIEGLDFALELLVPWAHWITPEIEKKRFNTRFFLAVMPEGQEAAHDEIELTDSLWLTPAEALARHEAGGILLMPPTLKTLEELSGYESASELFEAAAARRIYPVLPQGFKTDDGFGVMLPHDTEYSIEGYKQPERPGETSRIVMSKGCWKAVKGK
jgi:8-oxo-dGTP pyrophosphatase MutT (NUDIX family)